MKERAQKPEHRLQTLLEKQNGSKSNNQEMSMRGRSPKEMMPYLLSGEPDDMNVDLTKK